MKRDYSRREYYPFQERLKKFVLGKRIFQRFVNDGVMFIPVLYLLEDCLGWYEQKLDIEIRHLSLSGLIT